MEEADYVCENCNQRETQATLLKHISHRPDCKAFYGPRFEEMKLNEQKKRSDCMRNNYNIKKKDSDANLTLYHQDIEYGPEFVCISCHSGLFENEVLELTDQRRQKIDPKLFDKCCVQKPDFYDPRGKGGFFLCKYCFNCMTKKGTMPNQGQIGVLKMV